MSDNRRVIVDETLESQVSPTRIVRASQVELVDGGHHVNRIDSDDEGDDEDEVLVKRRRRSPSPPVASQSEDDGCSICLDNFTSDGAHRLVSLRCGHFFGHSCIVRWIQGEKQRGCPNCKTSAKMRDIRPHFAAAVKVRDNSETERLRISNEAYRRENEGLRLENAALTMRIEKILAEKNRCIERSVTDPFGITSVQRIKISKDGDSRAFAHNGDVFVIGVKNDMQQLFGNQFQYGVLVINNMGIRKEMRPLFAKRTRVIEFSPWDRHVYVVGGEDPIVWIRSSASSLPNIRVPVSSPVFSACWLSLDRVAIGTGDGRVWETRMDADAASSLIDLTNGEGRFPIVGLYRLGAMSLLIVSFRSIRVLHNGRLIDLLKEEFESNGRARDVCFDSESRSLVICFESPLAVEHILYDLVMENDEVVTRKMANWRTLPGKHSYMWKNDLTSFAECVCSVVFDEETSRVSVHDWSGSRSDVVFRTTSRVTMIRSFPFRDDIHKLVLLTETELVVLHLIAKKP